MTGATDERGSAVVETVLLGILFFVPLVWLLGVLGHTHRVALAATAAAREAGSQMATAHDATSAADAARDAVAQAFENQGLGAGPAELQLSGTGSFARGSKLRVRVSYPVTGLRVPLLNLRSRFWVRASHSVHIDPYRSR